MHNGVLGTFDAFKRALDQIFAALHEDLDGHIIRNKILVDEVAAEIKIGLRGRWKADFNFLETDFEQGIPHPHLALMAHGLNERLIAIAQIHAAPNGGGRDLRIGPFAIRQMDRREGAVFVLWIDHHDGILLRGFASAFKFPQGPRQKPRRLLRAAKKQQASQQRRRWLREGGTVSRRNHVMTLTGLSAFGNSLDFYWQTLRPKE